MEDQKKTQIFSTARSGWCQRWNKTVAKRYRAIYFTNHCFYFCPMLKSNICIPEIGSKVFRFNDIGLLKWYLWVLARVGCKNAGACESILKQTNANIHHYHFNNSFILEQKYLAVNLHELWVKFLSKFNVDWWYCILHQGVRYRQPHCSPVQYATGYTRHFCENLLKNS